ncbi:OsmC family protein [Halomonas sp. 18H]|uniref:OsmC family protein n=1 Tax=Halomonas almeriensis TaxID=308163 RepID=UPI00222F7D9F|nr:MULTISPECIES: OsmC family protein [Halomonas]MCW4151826.1 OsmC family protein [Halomonas sp. 18H]MDN3554072.1 OsmC family protein [Halomonas almeriensis]
MSIVLQSERDGRLRQRARIESFEDLLVDVPEAYGGDGQAPDPHDYFDLSLGACKAITAQMYARRKEWPLEGVEVMVVRDERDETRGIYRLDVIMSFQGDLDDAQRQRLEEISHKCPIHRLMTTSEVQINTRQTP